MTRSRNPGDDVPTQQLLVNPVSAVRVVTVANLKGGTGKTTTCAFLGHAWASRGLRVTFVDADAPQYALSQWSEMGEWVLPVVGLGSKQLHIQLPGILTPVTCDLAIVDTPPMEEQRGIVASALRAADDVIVTLSPTTADLHRAGAVFDAIEDAQAVRAKPANVSVLLNRVDLRSKAHETIRDALTEAGHHVLTEVVPSRQLYAQAFGEPVEVNSTWTAITAALDTRATIGRRSA